MICIALATMLPEANGCSSRAAVKAGIWKQQPEVKQYVSWRRCVPTITRGDTHRIDSKHDGHLPVVTLPLLALFTKLFEKWSLLSQHLAYSVSSLGVDSGKIATSRHGPLSDLLALVFVVVLVYHLNDVQAGDSSLRRGIKLFAFEFRGNLAMSENSWDVGYNRITHDLVQDLLWKYRRVARLEALVALPRIVDVATFERSAGQHMVVLTKFMRGA